jgi:hypothetical protein
MDITKHQLSFQLHIFIHAFILIIIARNIILSRVRGSVTNNNGFWIG